MANQKNQDLNIATGSKAARVFLVIDDHDVVRQYLLPLLTKGYPQAQILVAVDCQEAISQITEHSPELVLMDVYLPKVLGEMACYEQVFSFCGR